MKVLALASRSAGEEGFSLIELLWVLAIAGILMTLAYSNYMQYWQNAEFSKAELALKDARTAAEAGYDYITGAGFVFGTTASDGSALPATLSGALPGMNMSDQVMMRAMLFDCGNNHIMQSFTVYACKAQLYTSFFRTCMGFEGRIRKAAMAPGTC